MIYSGELRRQFKRQARESMKGHFPAILGATLLVEIPMLLIMAAYILFVVHSLGGWESIYQDIQNVSYVSMQQASDQGTSLYMLAVILVGSPLSLGLEIFFVAMARRRNTSPAAVFSCFESIRRWWASIKLTLFIFVRCIGWILLYVAIASAATGAAVFVGYDSSEAVFVGSLAVAFVCVLLVALLLGVKMYRYNAAYVMQADHPTDSVWAQTGFCAEIFRHHNWELFVFLLSFIGWYVLLGIITAVAISLVFAFGFIAGAVSILILIVAFVVILLLGVYISAYQNIAFVNYVDALMVDYQERQSRPDWFAN